MTKVQRSMLCIYGLLLILCVIMLLSANYLGPIVRDSAVPLAAEGFKLVLAALIGAVSTILGAGGNSQNG